MVGETIAGYRVVEKIGQGGMGTVYKAVDEALNKTVALKVMLPSLLEDPTFSKRFRSEARALAKLDAKNIVRVHALRDTDHGTFLVMEYVEGQTLSSVLEAHAPLPVDETLALFTQMVRAIEHAHAADVLHRDLKPSNILVSDEGTVKITDFGLAKIRDEDVNLTSTHETAGTLCYMSPEQVEGLRNVNEQSDLFSLGLVLYEMLTGRLPFDRTSGNYTIQRAIVEESFPPPSDFRNEISPGLDRFTQRLITKDPAERPQSAALVLEALQALEEPSAITGTLSFAEPDSSNKWSLAGISSVIVAVGIFLAITGFLVVRTVLSPSPEAPLQEEAFQESNAPVSLSIATTPDSASIFVNGENVGRSPLQALNVSPGPASLRVVQEGYEQLDTTLSLTSSQTVELTLDRRSTTDEPVEPQTTAERQGPSQPSEAGTDLTDEGSQSSPSFSESDAEPDAEPGAESGVESETTPATLSLQIIPSGEVRVNGVVQSVANNGSFVDTRSPGTYTIAATYRDREWEQTVTLTAGESWEHSVDFTRQFDVAITTETARGERLANAEVLVNGEAVGYTPQRLSLRTGRYTIAVQKEGYQTVEQEILVDPALDTPLTIQLDRVE